MEQQRAETLNSQARRAIWGAFAGFFVDGFDIFLPVLALAPAQAYFFSPAVPESTAAILVSLTLVATLIGRPLGALIFGGLADRIGRKRTTVIVVTGFGTMTRCSWDCCQATSSGALWQSSFLSSCVWSMAYSSVASTRPPTLWLWSNARRKKEVSTGASSRVVLRWPKLYSLPSCW